MLELVADHWMELLRKGAQGDVWSRCYYGPVGEWLKIPKNYRAGGWAVGFFAWASNGWDHIFHHIVFVPGLRIGFAEGLEYAIRELRGR